MFCLHSSGTYRPPLLTPILCQGSICSHHPQKPSWSWVPECPLSVSCGVLLATTLRCVLEQREEHSLRKVYTAVKASSINMILKMMHFSLWMFGCTDRAKRQQYPINSEGKDYFRPCGLRMLFQTLLIVALNCQICIDIYLQLSFSFTQRQ